LLSEAALACGEVAQGAQEVDLAEVGAERLDEVELAVRALPQHEVAQSLLARGANDEVGVGLPSRVQVLADEVGGENLGTRVAGSALVGVIARAAADGVGDLATARVADREVDVQATLAIGARRRGRAYARELVGKPCCVADVF